MQEGHGPGTGLPDLGRLPTADELDWMSGEGMRAVMRVMYGEERETLAIEGLRSVYARERVWVERLFTAVVRDRDAHHRPFNPETHTAYQTMVHSIDSSLQQLAVERRLYTSMLDSP